MFGPAASTEQDTNKGSKREKKEKRQSKREEGGKRKKDRHGLRYRLDFRRVSHSSFSLSLSFVEIERERDKDGLCGWGKGAVGGTTVWAFEGDAGVSRAARGALFVCGCFLRRQGCKKCVSAALIGNNPPPPSRIND